MTREEIENALKKSNLLVRMNQQVIKDKDGIKTYIGDVPAVLNRIAEQYQEEIDENKKLKQALKNFKADVYKNEELKKMKEDYERMKDEYYRGFPMTPIEQDKIFQWKVDHENNHHGGFPCNHGAIGGGYNYMFCPTGIGTFGVIVCESCRTKAIEESRGDRNKYCKLLKEYDTSFSFKEDV